MKKILVLTEEFCALTNANGVCTKAIVDALSQKNNVMVLSTIDSFENTLPSEYDGTKTVYQRNVWWEFRYDSNQSPVLQKIINLLGKTRNLLMKPFFPVGSISPIIRFYLKACKLHEQYHFDIILCFFHPFEAFIVGSMLKIKYPGLRVVHYMLDSLSNYTPNVKLLSKEFCHNRYIKLENWGYSHCDCIINLQVQNKFYSRSPRYDKFRSKMVYADIPLFKEQRKLDSYLVHKGTMIYAGSLAKAFRNPTYALKLFSALPDNYKAIFYCSGDCNDLISEYASKYNTIVAGGYIQHDLLEKKLAESEVLINIGNYKLNMIPSKIFEYFSFEKKIIHFYKDDNDTCIPYLKKYPYALLIDERDNFEDNLNKLLDFLGADSKTKYSEEWHKNFTMNTPEFSAKLIVGDNG